MVFDGILERIPDGRRVVVIPQQNNSPRLVRVHIKRQKNFNQQLIVTSLTGLVVGSKVIHVFRRRHQPKEKKCNDELLCYSGGVMSPRRRRRKTLQSR